MARKGPRTYGAIRFNAQLYGAYHGSKEFTERLCINLRRMADTIDLLRPKSKSSRYLTSFSMGNATWSAMAMHHAAAHIEALQRRIDTMEAQTMLWEIYLQEVMMGKTPWVLVEASGGVVQDVTTYPSDIRTVIIDYDHVDASRDNADDGEYVLEAAALFYEKLREIIDPGPLRKRVRQEIMALRKR